MNYAKLVEKVQQTYESGVTMEEAEKLAAEFLHAQIQVADTLKVADLDARMKKSGVKAIRSAVRSEEVRKHDRKPAEGQLDDVVNLSPMVKGEQDALDEAEVNRDWLQNYLTIFANAHVFYRGVAKGSFNG